MVSRSDALQASIGSGLFIGIFTFSAGMAASYPVESSATLAVVAGVASAGLGYLGMKSKKLVSLIRGA